MQTDLNDSKKKQEEMKKEENVTKKQTLDIKKKREYVQRLKLSNQRMT